MSKNSIDISIDVTITDDMFSEYWDMLDEDDKLEYLKGEYWTDDAIDQIQEHIVEGYFDFTANELDELTQLLLKTRPCDINDSIYQKVQQMREYAK